MIDGEIREGAVNETKQRKRIDIKEFQEFGYLQEANRLFFHSLGLALEVIVDEETGSVTLGGVWDSRADPEGILFTAINYDKFKRVADERIRRRGMRMNLPECNSKGIQVEPFEGGITDNWLRDRE